MAGIAYRGGEEPLTAVERHFPLDVNIVGLRVKSSIATLTGPGVRGHLLAENGGPGEPSP